MNYFIYVHKNIPLSLDRMWDINIDLYITYKHAILLHMYEIPLICLNALINCLPKWNPPFLWKIVVLIKGKCLCVQVFLKSTD